MNKNILIIDDEIGICTSLSLAIENDYGVKAVTSPEEGLRLLREEYFNICLLDLRIGIYNGIDVLKEIKKLDKNLIVIIMTAFASIDSSVEAIKAGAFTYLTKPLNISELKITIEQALEFQRLNEKVEYLSQELQNKYVYNGIIGRSPIMKNIFKMIEKLNNIDTNVMITGESGTGKELVARAIHYSGKRKKERFEEINCAAIPEGLLEEEFFGHKKGAFTGAVNDSIGKLEATNNGTLFLDEIGDMPLAFQAKFLRVLQQKECTPIGSTEKKKLNIRIISATNKNLKEMVETREFRQDLYFRLNVVEISMPSLREKKQDLPLLFNHFIQHYNCDLGKNIKSLSRKAEKILLDYNYPGNIRELANIFEYAMVVSNGETIYFEDLPEEVKKYKIDNYHGHSVFTEDLIGLPLREVERCIIKENLIRNNNVRKTTANILGISEKGLRNKIKEYNL